MFAKFLEGMYGAELSKVVHEKMDKLPDNEEGLKAKEEVRVLFKKYLKANLEDVKGIVDEMRTIFNKFSIDLGNNV